MGRLKRRRTHTEEIAGIRVMSDVGTDDESGAQSAHQSDALIVGASEHSGDSRSALTGSSMDPRNAAWSNLPTPTRGVLKTSATAARRER